MNILLFIAIFLIIFLCLSIVGGMYISPQFKSLIYNLVITVGGKLGMNQLYWKEPKWWSGKGGTKKGKSIYKQTYDCGKGANYKICEKKALVQMNVPLPSNADIGSYTTPDCNKQCNFNQPDKTTQTANMVVSIAKNLGIGIISFEIMQELFKIALRAVVTAGRMAYAAIGRFCTDGLTKLAESFGEMAMFADLGPVGWAIDAAMLFGMVLSFWDPFNMADCLFNRSTVLPQRNNNENSLQLFCKNSNISYPPLFPLSFLSFGQSKENMDNPGNWTGIGKIAFAWQCVKGELNCQIMKIAMGQWQNFSSYITEFLAALQLKYPNQQPNQSLMSEIIKGTSPIVENNPKLKAYHEEFNSILVDVRNSISVKQRDDFLWKKLTGTYTNGLTNQPESLSDLNKSYLMRVPELATLNRVGISLSEKGVCAINKILNSRSVMDVRPGTGYCGIFTKYYRVLDTNDPVGTVPLGWGNKHLSQMGGAGSTFPNMVLPKKNILTRPVALISQLQSVMYMCTIGGATGKDSGLSMFCGSTCLTEEETIKAGRKSKWPSIRKEYSQQKLISTKPKGWVGFWNWIDKNSNKYDRAQAILPMQFGVTFNPDVGLCNITKRYCDEKGVSFMKEVNIGGQVISDCNTTTTQTIFHTLFGPLQNWVSSGVDLLVDAKNRGLLIDPAFQYDNNGNVFCPPGYSGSQTQCVKCPPGTEVTKSALAIIPTCGPKGGCSSLGSGWKKQPGLSNCLKPIHVRSLAGLTDPLESGINELKSLLTTGKTERCSSGEIKLNSITGAWCSAKRDNSLCYGIDQNKINLNMFKATHASECACGAKGAIISSIADDGATCQYPLNNSFSDLFEGKSGLKTKPAVCPPWKPCQTGAFCGAPCPNGYHGAVGTSGCQAGSPGQHNSFGKIDPGIKTSWYATVDESSGKLVVYDSPGWCEKGSLTNTEYLNKNPKDWMGNFSRVPDNMTFPKGAIKKKFEQEKAQLAKNVALNTCYHGQAGVGENRDLRGQETYR